MTSLPCARLATEQAQGEFSMSSMTDSSEYDEAYNDPVMQDFASALFTEALDKIPRRATVIVPSTASIRDAIDAMNEEHTGCALVERNGKLAGIFTERDVLTKVAGKTSIDAPV